MEKITKLLNSQFLLFFIIFTTTASAQIGIGTTTPSLMLDVETNALADGIQINNTRGNGDPILQYQVNGNSQITMGIDDNDDDKFKIGTTGITANTRLTIQTNGYIGVGLTAPAYHFHLVNNRNNYLAYFENTNTNGSSLAGYVNGTYNALGGITNNNNGLGIYGVHLPATGSGTSIWGTSNSSDAIGVYGTIPTTGSWLGFGGLFTGALGYANGLYNLSDERVKSNIVTIDNAINKLKQIRGVSYTYNLDEYNYLAKGDTRTYLGFLAQNIKETFPEAVAEKNLIVDGPDKVSSTINNSEFKREVFNVVDYTSLIPVTVEAIKEQQEIIENQNNKIDTLEDKITVLENKLNELIDNQN
ncbi:tail fiber domain-containing protein [Oceanihabitans sp. 2_MG-2023]|uniref:tail fiber domain-containing protein n=1 Tax=Oceanihabitans sp. 2_MG-2023 TaxID=3062661 RepID=UPI0026E2E803|nr:tail fiber domain-containing protein [Oceanihabitans sp. 2_MG-2023]MDO6597511.1 tail fiber domain-containing protein [Oceanihabitans sp. 2_MG-2023]